MCWCLTLDFDDRAEKRGGISFSLFIKILAILYRNIEEELSANELILKYRISKETFYRAIGLLEECGLIVKKNTSRSERGSGRITIYMLNDKGKLYFEHCIKPYFGSLVPPDLIT